MSKKVLFVVMVAFVFWGAGCGKSQRNLEERAQADACPLYFASEELCAEINWVKGPSADIKSAFEVVFWKKGSSLSKEALVDPVSQVGAFLRMSCCGSVSFPKIEKTGVGQFSVTEASFMPGNWEVYVQLKQGETIEKQFVKVQVND